MRFPKPSELTAWNRGSSSRNQQRGVVILVYRSEEKNDDHKTTSRKIIYRHEMGLNSDVTAEEVYDRCTGAEFIKYRKPEAIRA